MKKLLIFLFLFAFSFGYSQEFLPVYKMVKGKVDESNPVGQLSRIDQIKELPIPKEKVKKVSYVKDPKSKKKKKVEKWVEREPSVPPTFVPIECKLGKVYARRAELARFQQESLDMSGEYASETGSVFLKKSPNNPRKFNIIIQNGPEGNRAEIEMGDLEGVESNNRLLFHFQEDGCVIDMILKQRRVKVDQQGCEAYNSGNFTLTGKYITYKGNTRRVETFNMPETKLKFKKFLWCSNGFDSCEKIKDDNGTVQITWSKDGNGFIERKAGDAVHLYRPFEHVIPRKSSFYKGEKPIVLKTKRTDMAGEWMLWYFYPKAERLKMVRAGMAEDNAYMEIYE